MNRIKGINVFQYLNFSRRGIYFIHSQGSCKRIPNYEKENGLETLLENFESMDSLILNKLPFMQILSKFETPDMIHSYLAIDNRGQSTLKVDLYRFGLTFVWNKGIFECSEVTGYCLSNKQHLKGTFRGFRKYLILCHSSNDNAVEKVLVPTGDIIVSDISSVSIKAPQSCETP